MNNHLSGKLEFAKEQLEIGNYGRVERITNILIENKDKSFLKEGLRLKGVSLFYQNRMDEAYQLFSELIEKFPLFPDAYFYRFEILIELVKFGEARIDALSLISIDQSNPEYLNKLIIVDEYLGHYESVIETCDKILNLYPNDSLFLATRGGAKLELKQFENAIQDFEKSLINSDEIEQSLNYNNIGFAYSNLGEYQKAKKALIKSLELDETEPFALNNLGFVLSKLGEVEKGLNLINQSIKIAPENSYAFKNRAKIFLERGDLSKAKKDLHQAKELDYEILYGNEVNELLEKIKADENKM